jgi:hypothetical protein
MMKGDESPKVSLKKARSTLVTMFMFGWFASKPLLKVMFPKETCRKYGAIHWCRTHLWKRGLKFSGSEREREREEGEQIRK